MGEEERIELTASALGLLGKAPKGCLLVRIHLEDFVQLSDLQHSINLFRRIQKLQLATLGLSA